MAVVLFSSTHPKEAAPWARALRAEMPDVDFRIAPDGMGRPADIDVALVWKPPQGLLASLPNLKAMINLGAGVDGLLADPTLPPGVPLARLVDPALTSGMTEYVVHGVLHFHRGFPAMGVSQRARQWVPAATPATAARRVGILGFGELGQNAAQHLTKLGFDVAGWSRTDKTVEGVESYAGPDALTPFLRRSDILVCLLPLTPDTQGILNAQTFAALPKGAFVINAARGSHVVEADLLAALESGHVAGAMLDVFQVEPLPEAHPFWTHPAVIITPHIASLTVAKSAAPRVAENINRAMAGKPLLDLVNRNRGY